MKERGNAPPTAVVEWLLSALCPSAFCEASRAGISDYVPGTCFLSVGLCLQRDIWAEVGNLKGEVAQMRVTIRRQEQSGAGVAAQKAAGSDDDAEWGNGVQYSHKNGGSYGAVWEDYACAMQQSSAREFISLAFTMSNGPGWDSCLASVPPYRRVFTLTLGAGSLLPEMIDSLQQLGQALAPALVPHLPELLASLDLFLLPALLTVSCSPLPFDSTPAARPPGGPDPNPPPLLPGSDPKPDPNPDVSTLIDPKLVAGDPNPDVTTLIDPKVVADDPNPDVSTLIDPKLVAGELTEPSRAAPHGLDEPEGVAQGRPRVNVTQDALWLTFQDPAVEQAFQKSISNKRLLMDSLLLLCLTLMWYVTQVSLSLSQAQSVEGTLSLRQVWQHLTIVLYGSVFAAMLFSPSWYCRHRDWIVSLIKFMTCFAGSMYMWQMKADQPEELPTIISYLGRVMPAIYFMKAVYMPISLHSAMPFEGTAMALASESIYQGCAFGCPIGDYSLSPLACRALFTVYSVLVSSAVPVFISWWIEKGERARFAATFN